MSSTPRWLLGSLRVCGTVALLMACAPAVEGAQPGGDAAKAAPDSPDPITTDQEFENPETIAKRFTTELARLAERRDVVSPMELVRQVETKKSCTIETLPDPGQKLSPEAIYAKARQSVVVVGGTAKVKKRRDAQLAPATGFVIRQDGVIVTNCHVVVGFEDMKAVGVMTADGRMFPIKAVLAADSRNDIAVLKIEADNLRPLPLAANVAVGAPIYCLSHPALNTRETETGFYTFTQGMVSNKFRLRLHGHAPLNVLAITAAYAKGSSGGPILNEHGAVVGIVCETLPIYGDENEQDVQMVWKFCRPSSSILALLRDTKPASKQ